MGVQGHMCVRMVHKCGGMDVCKALHSGGSAEVRVHVCEPAGARVGTHECASMPTCKATQCTMLHMRITMRERAAVQDHTHRAMHTHVITHKRVHTPAVPCSVCALCTLHTHQV